MLAARWHARGDVRVEEIGDPGPPPPGWVRLRIDACGICGTDLEEYRSGPVLVPTSPHPLSHRSAPLTLGHEPAGTVEAVGKGVDLREGTRVAVETNMHCGECWWCRRGETQLCVHLACLGLMADGGLAEVMLAPASMCAPYAGGVPAVFAAMAEPLSVAVRAVRRSGVQKGAGVGIVGCGTVGLLALQVARRAGAERIVAVDTLEQRRELARRLGATAALPPDRSAEAVLEMTAGVGLDTVIEAGGSARAALAAIELTRRGGRTLLLGIHREAIPVDALDMMMREREIVASLSHTFAGDFVPAVRLIDEGAVDLAPLVSDRVPLAEVVERGFDALLGEPTRHLKIIVVP